MRSIIKLAALCALSLLAVAVDAEQASRKVCNVKAGGTNTTDDAPAILEAFDQCGKNGRVVFEDTTYYVNSVMNVTGLDDVEVDIHGTLLVCSFPCVP